MPVIILIAIIIVRLLWSAGKRSNASREADRINANRKNPYRP